MFLNKKKQEEVTTTPQQSEKTKLINNLEELEALIDIMKAKKVDCIKVDGIEIYVSKHEYAEAKPTGKQKTQEEIEEEILFYSAQ